MSKPTFDRNGVARRLAPKLRAELLKDGLVSAETADRQIAEALAAVTTGAQIQNLRESGVYIRLSGMVDAEAREVLSPHARFNRDQAERYAASHEPARRATPVAEVIGPDYAAQYARAAGIDLAVGRAHFARIAAEETAVAFRKAQLNEDASSSARRALHFTLLAGVEPEADLRTLAGNRAPLPGDFG